MSKPTAGPLPGSRPESRRRPDYDSMASFPEQNPNMVIEVSVGGEVTYMNPVAKQRFPDLPVVGTAHPLLADLDGAVRQCRESDRRYISREVDLGEAVFEQKVCLVGDDLVHIYSHNITALRRAEESVNEMAGQLRLLAQRIVLAQEQERKRIAQELHDEAGQAMIALKLSLEILRSDLPTNFEEIRTNLSEAIGMIDATRNQIRMLAQGLRPPALDTLGIRLAVEEFCEAFGRRTKLEIRYESSEIPEISEAASICFYRCLQEALTNVVHHAKASQVSVRLEMMQKILSLSVSDNGVGMDESTFESSRQSPTGIGLLGMKERLELLGGGLEINSAARRGTTLLAWVPVEGP